MKSLLSDQLSLEVVRLDRTNWRVARLSADADGKSEVLGYVERVERDRYEVLWLGDPVGWGYVTSLDAAIAALVDRDHFDGVLENRLAKSKDSPAPLLHRIRRRSEQPIQQHESR